HRAQQRLLAHGTIVTALAGHAQPVGRRLRADEALAMRAKPAGAGGVERHGGAAIGTVYRSGILPESGCAGVAELADASDLKDRATSALAGRNVLNAQERETAQSSGTHQVLGPTDRRALDAAVALLPPEHRPSVPVRLLSPSDSRVLLDRTK